jgi:hypothetical protein
LGGRQLHAGTENNTALELATGLAFLLWKWVPKRRKWLRAVLAGPASWMGMKPLLKTWL